jgi:DNA-binding protein HU-beta
MNRGGYVAAVAAKIGAARAEADRAVEAALEVIKAEMERGGEVRLPGFGTFGVKDTAARTGRNPHTGAPIDIAATRRPYFKPAKPLKDVVANGRRAA